MSYHSKVRLLVRGSKESVKELVGVFEQRSELTTIGEIHHTKPEAYYKSMLTMLKRVDRGGTSVLIYDSNWFKAMGEWDEHIRNITNTCEGFGLDWSYARIGEMEDDFESDSNSPDGHIALRREFELPILYGEVLYGEGTET